MILHASTINYSTRLLLAISNHSKKTRVFPSIIDLIRERGIPSVPLLSSTLGIYGSLDSSSSAIAVATLRCRHEHAIWPVCTLEVGKLQGCRLYCCCGAKGLWWILSSTGSVTVHFLRCPEFMAYQLILDLISHTDSLFGGCDFRGLEKSCLHS